MKLGVICEGEKTDGPVLRKLLEAEFPAADIVIRATSKQVIFSAIGTIVDELLSGGCEGVIIVWDLHPVGTQMSVTSQTVHAEPCQRDQRQTLLEIARKTSEACQADVAHLQQRYGFLEEEVAGDDRVRLVCFCESFDAVFLSDEALLRKLASSEIRGAEPPPRVKVPTTVARPQQLIRQYFRSGHNKQLKYFNKCEHNIVLARAFIEHGRLSKLRKHQGYRRLVTLIEVWTAVG
jgi:hypothetical protein